MLLALSVISAQGAGMGAAAYKIFDTRGGSIGRLEANDWALPDPERFVSSRHAVVHFAGGAFCLEDVSTNGTFLNAPHLAVARGERTPLNDGDRVYIGDYEILVQLIDDGVPADAAGTLESLGTADPLAVIGTGVQVAPADEAHQRPAHQAPAQGGATHHGPAHRDPARRDQAPDLFAALGLDPGAVDPALAAELAGILRTAATGVIDALRAQSTQGPARLEDIGKDWEVGLRLLFGEQFARAYHQRLEMLAQSANSLRETR